MKTEKMPSGCKECLGELVDVLSRYQGKLYRDDGKDILAHLAMVFEGQDEKSAARLLHESGMDLVFFHGLAPLQTLRPAAVGPALDGIML